MDHTSVKRDAPHPSCKVMEGVRSGLCKHDEEMGGGGGGERCYREGYKDMEVQGRHFSGKKSVRGAYIYWTDCSTVWVLVPVLWTSELISCRYQSFLLQPTAVKPLQQCYWWERTAVWWSHRQTSETKLYSIFVQQQPQMTSAILVSPVPGLCLLQTELWWGQMFNCSEVWLTSSVSELPAGICGHVKLWSVLTFIILSHADLLSLDLPWSLSYNVSEGC